MTLGCLLSSVGCFKKVVYDGWLGALTMIFPSPDIDLGIDQMINLE